MNQTQPKTLPRTRQQHPNYTNAHMDVWHESLQLCQSEGADACAEATVWLIQKLVVSSPATSNYRELPRTKEPWKAYFTEMFQTCPRLQKPGATEFSPEYNRCREAATNKLVAAGSGNTVLKIDRPIALSWVAFFDLPACVLVSLPGKCAGGVACDKLLGWSSDKCYSKAR
jgi:hypothetical protein